MRRWGGGNADRRRDAGLGIVGVDDRLGDVCSGGKPEHAAVLLTGVENQVEALLLGIGLHHVKDLLADLLKGLLAVILGVALKVLCLTLQSLGFVVDGAHAVLALDIAEGGSGILKLLFQGIDLLIFGLEFLFPWLVFLAEVSDIALEFVGLTNGCLELDDGDFGGAGN